MRLEKDKTKWKRNESCISNGNQLTSVEDSVTTPMVYSGAFNFKNGTTQTTEYVYDACGAMTQDKNKGVALIDYDYNGMPTRIQFRNGNVTEHVYSADGVKLKTVHRTAVSGINVAYGTRHTLTASETLSADSICYIGDLEYRNGQNIKWYFGEGYVQLPVTGYGATQHYMIADHLGNVRVVVKEDGTVEQVNNYFAYGGLLNDVTTGADVQTHKYNGKELDRMHGLDTYDYGARNYDAALGQFTTMDPLCEKYYHISPYAYCGGNPVNRVDPDGEDWYMNKEGDYLWQPITSKTYIDTDGNKWKGLGHSFTDKETNTYYSLFGQKYDDKKENRKERRAAETIDKAVMEYAQWVADNTSNTDFYTSETVPPPNADFNIFPFNKDYSGLKNNPNQHWLSYAGGENNGWIKIYNNRENGMVKAEYMIEKVKYSNMGYGKNKGVYIVFWNKSGDDTVSFKIPGYREQIVKAMYDNLIKSYKK